MSVTTPAFLADREPHQWATRPGFPFSLTPRGVFTQNAPGGLEVALASASLRPSPADIRKAWDNRVAGRATPVHSRTIIAALVPGNVVSTDQAPSLLWPRGTARDEAYLPGVLSSMILDWYARRVVQLHIKFYVINNFPIPRCDPIAHPIATRVVEIAGRLAAVDDRFADWAAEVGVPVGSTNDPDVKRDLIHELDACVAHLYGLDEDDLAVIYETFDHKRPDRYAERHAAVLKHFRRMK